MDRVLGRFPLDAGVKGPARASLRARKLALNDEIVVLNQTAMTSLRDLLGEDNVQKFMSAVVMATANGRPAAQQASASRDDVVAQLLGFDQDDNQSLDADEQEELLKQIKNLPGGLGQASPPAPEMSQFAEQMLAFDANGDNCVTADELPERMSSFAQAADANGDGALTLAEAQSRFTAAAFLQLRDEGIYIGGAFDNTLLFHRQRLHEIGLSDELAAEGDAILDRHAQAIETAWQAAFAEQIEMIHQLARPDSQR